MKKPHRIVSLIASSTEIVCALGFEKDLVGISHECDYPPSILKLPRCTETKFVADGTSYEIDQRIKAILQEGLSVYRVYGDKLKELKPDVIITQIQCEVCAVSERDVIQAVYDWTGQRPEIVALNPNCLEDIWSDIRKVAHSLHAPERGDTLIAKLQGRINTIQGQASRAEKKQRVACIEWIEPLMAAGNWVPELVELAGGTNLFGLAGKHSPWMKWEDLVAKDPDMILVMPCGFDIQRTRGEMYHLKSMPEWSQLRAVRENRVFLCDGNQYFNRPGPRVVESLEILAELMHPEMFQKKHEHSGWVRYEMPSR